MKNILYIILFLPFFAVAQNPALQISGGGGTTINNSTTITNPAEVSPCLSGFFAVSDGSGGVDCIDTTGIFATGGGGTDDQEAHEVNVTGGTYTGQNVEEALDSLNVAINNLSGGGGNPFIFDLQTDTGVTTIVDGSNYTITGAVNSGITTNTTGSGLEIDVADNSSTNELQTISFNPSNRLLAISSANSVTIPRVVTISQGHTKSSEALVAGLGYEITITPEMDGMTWTSYYLQCSTTPSGSVVEARAEHRNAAGALIGSYNIGLSGVANNFISPNVVVNTGDRIWLNCTAPGTGNFGLSATHSFQ